jgi:hypothetical protein
MSMSRNLKITTLTTAAVVTPEPGDDMCEIGRTCEGVHTLSGNSAEYYVITTEVTDPDVLAAFASRLGRGERLGTVQRRIIDEVPR